MGLGAYILVRDAQGLDKRVEDVRQGERMFDPVSGIGRAVTKIWQGPAVGMYRIVLENDSLLDLTEDHAVMTADGLLPANRIATGTMVLAEGGYSRCVEATPLPGDFMVYDLVVDAKDGGMPCLLAGGAVAGAIAAK